MPFRYFFDGQNRQYFKIDENAIHSIALIYNYWVKTAAGQYSTGDEIFYDMRNGKEAAFFGEKVQWRDTAELYIKFGDVFQPYPLDTATVKFEVATNDNVNPAKVLLLTSCPEIKLVTDIKECNSHTIIKIRKESLHVPNFQNFMSVEVNIDGMTYHGIVRKPGEIDAYEQFQVLPLRDVLEFENYIDE